MLSVYGTSGFYRAPVSLGLVWTSLVSSFAFSFPLSHHRHLLTSTPSLLLDKHQLWRLFSSKLAFLDLKDLFVCCMLIYYFRIFERRFGSRKFAYHLLASGVPICFVFPLFVPYYFDIPRVAMTHILGVPVTGKTLTYILGLQVASPTFETRLVATCGIMGGLLWRVNFLKIQSLVWVPQWLARMCDASLGRLLQSGVSRNEKVPMGATLELQRQEELERLEQQMVMAFQSNQTNNLHLPRPQPLNLANGPGIFGNPDFLIAPGLRQRNNTGEGVEPDSQAEDEVGAGDSVQLEDQVQRLVEMGFSQDRVRHALQLTNNNISMATNVLLQET